MCSKTKKFTAAWLSVCLFLPSAIPAWAQPMEIKAEAMDIGHLNLPDADRAGFQENFNFSAAPNPGAAPGAEILPQDISQTIAPELPDPDNRPAPDFSITAAPSPNAVFPPKSTNEFSPPHADKKIVPAAFSSLEGAAQPSVAQTPQESLGVAFDGNRSESPEAAALQFQASPANPELETWIETERAIAVQRMSLNIASLAKSLGHPLDGAALGAVAASPSRENPDYWYNWRRDAALTMTQVVTLYHLESDPTRKGQYFQALSDYANFVQEIQKLPLLTGMGEPKTNMDGTPFNGPWGRPQNDGPAEEASALIKFAKALMAEGNFEMIQSLYGDDAMGIKADLNYVCNFWKNASFDVWEEQKAHHFDTSLAQRTALLEGAWLAEYFGDQKTADKYYANAWLLEAEIEKHWDGAKGYIVSSFGREDGVDYKTSGLDAAVILAAVHRKPINSAMASLRVEDTDFFSVTDKRMLATFTTLKQTFKALYPINQRPGVPGSAIGRYPEDRYFNGNPWVLLTNAFAQFQYMAAEKWLMEGVIQVEQESLEFFKDILGEAAGVVLFPGQIIRLGEPLFEAVIQGLKQSGDDFLARVKYHANPDGSLSEQMDKNTGFMISARDLTWNYASFLAAVWARDRLLAAMARRTSR